MGELEKSFLASHVPEAGNVCQGEGEAELVLVADGAEGEPAELHGDAAAIPVVAGLEGAVLQEFEVLVHADVGGGAQSALVGMSVADERAHLIEAVGSD